jgi:hypothetical protein
MQEESTPKRKFFSAAQLGATSVQSLTFQLAPQRQLKSGRASGDFRRSRRASERNPNPRRWCRNSAILVGCGFSHDIIRTKQARLHQLKYRF